MADQRDTEKKIFNCIYLLLSMRGLHCWVGFSLDEASGGYSLVGVHGLLVAVASLIVEHRFWSAWAS